MKSLNNTENGRDTSKNEYKSDLENKAIELAQQHNWMGLNKNGISLQDYMKPKNMYIKDAYNEINNYYYLTEDVIPAAEWYLDNYYLINDLLKEMEKDLSKQYEAKLNYFKEGDHSGYPRIYIVITEYIKYAHEEMDFDALRLFISRYQKAAPLSSAEIWAIPIVLRVILLEKLYSQVEKIISTQKERETAESWLKSILSKDADEEQSIKRSQRRDFSPVFIERVARRLKDYGTDAKVLLNWLDNIAANSNKTVEDIMAAVQYSQTSSGVGMGNIISAIKLVNSENWSAFFEDVSLVQEILRNDPAKVFNRMDFGSRDKYRHEIENLAHKYKVTEISVARLIQEYAMNATDLPQTHVGYYLLGAGRIALEKELAVSLNGVKKRIHNFNCLCREKPALGYFSAITGITALIIGILLWKFNQIQNINFSFSLILLVFSVLVLGNGIAVYSVNRAACQLLPPTFLPKIDFEQGLNEENKSIVVIPAIFDQASIVKELFAHLEQHYLNNRSENLFFAILGDFADSDEQETECDSEIIYMAQKEILKLNKKYNTKCFYYFHRKRSWNEQEKKWMGWERKRGKLIQFNQLLMKINEESACKEDSEEKADYNVQIGDMSELKNMRYVITADADTVIPDKTVGKLVGIMAHPLHRARIKDEVKLINDGYGIVQPRISVLASCASATGFSKLFTGNAGIDPYTCAISDVYQDIFGEGIFTGKGIYDLQTFNEATGDRFPENRILSHDLIEGLFARTALATDIEFFDGYPAKYLSYTSRLHRWIRGDWQILRYVFHKELPIISRWKIIDNLRRSLEEPCRLLLLILAFGFFDIYMPYIIGLVILSISWPFLINLFKRIATRSITYRIFNQEIKTEFGRIIFILSVLPYQAYIQLDAIARSLIRQMTGRYLLEWETAADSERRIETNIMAYYLKMLPGVLITFMLALFIPFVSFSASVLLVCLIIVWSASPWAACRLSLPANKKQRLDRKEIQELRIFAREIWGFFDRYINEADNYLPPDNVQIEPDKGIAHRTSPTNIGLAFLANLSAYDFGYISAGRMLERTENMLKTIDKLSKWKGHLYNWYDTETLKPLHPVYVSTVDSGNLAGYYLTLRNGLAELKDKKVIDSRIIDGLRDTCQALIEHDEKDENNQTLMVFIQELNDFDTGIDIRKLYKFLAEYQTETFSMREGDKGYFFSQSLQKMLEDAINEILRFFPWLTLEQSAVQENFSGLCNDYTFRELTIAYRAFLEEEGTPSDLRQKISEGLTNIIDLFNQNGRIQKRLYTEAMQMDFRPLFDQQKKLFAIGYNVTEQSLDKSYYDLLASEARQTSLLAIAKGDVPQSHWFKLSRPLTKINGKRCLVSWSGTMFEFLMPLVLIKNYQSTLLDETYKSVVEIQKSYGDQAGIPWGISESGFFLFDIQNNYQYKAFGVPGLGLKRGLTRDMVISPYSTFMALMVDAEAALANLRRMRNTGFNGLFGLYEAIDFTTERVQYKHQFSIVKSYMAHHQGMSLASLSNAVFDNIMQKRFHREPQIKAVELMLQEQVPLKEYTFNPIIEETREKKLSSKIKRMGEKPVTYSSPNTVIPRTHFLSNTEFSVMLTLSGSGYSKYNKKYVTRWTEDQTVDAYGSYIYVHNLNSGNVWSATSKPMNNQGTDYKVTCFPNLIRYSRKDGNIITQTEIIVSPEDAIEIRKVSLTNESKYYRDIELTSYAEIVLDELAADQAHPAFNKLFIQTSFEDGTLYASKRSRRHNNNSNIFLMHTVYAEGDQIGEFEFETDRAKFIGRGRNYSNPKALDINQPLSGSAGSVIDPIMSLRVRVKVPPGRTKEVFFLTGVAEDKQSVRSLSLKYRNSNMLKKVRELSWSQNLMELTALDLSFEEANLLMSLASHVIFLGPQQRSNIARNNTKGQSSLWSYGISGDLPIIILRLQDLGQLSILDQMLKIHEYWKIKGLFVDLVVINEDKTGYYQTVQEIINEKVGLSHARRLMNKPGGVFLLKRDLLPGDIQYLLFSIARVVFSGENGSLYNQILKHVKNGEHIAAFQENELKADKAEKEISSNKNIYQSIINDLIFYNGFGGFASDGKEYVMEISSQTSTPMPWVNIIANPNFGFMVSESGSICTWSQNSREYKLSPWFNDPLLDKTGEAVYIKDLDKNHFWSPLPKAANSEGPYLVRHGQGYSVFKNQEAGIIQETTMYVPIESSYKVVGLKLQNTANTAKNLALYYYLEWVLGVNRGQHARFIMHEEEKGTIYVQNTYQEEFAGRTAYLTAIGGNTVAYTCSREEFIGQNQSLESPKGLDKPKLEALSGSDPCGAIQVEITIPPKTERTIYFIVGDEKDKASAKATAEGLSQERLAEDLNEAIKFWDDLLSTLQFETPDKSFNLLTNRWLLYQTLGCRIWARSAYYQAGGAYGFRDQLQDVMALTVIKPDTARRQIILSSSRQFEEGDVQHWWHQENGKGIRTKFSDDLLWLPYVTLDYLEHTADYSILDEQTEYLTEQLLAEDEDERYSIPSKSRLTGTIYEHCVKAIDHSLKFGEHGLPLIGTGDWNDGFSAVGREGKGESVWLGWFLLTILHRIIPIVEKMHDEERLQKYDKIKEELINSIEKHGWDGAWYRRAYFDNADPLGSICCKECQIDAIAQSWAIISGFARESRGRDAMTALENYLWDKDEGILKLLTPPFNESGMYPGYIQGYVPGVRENGGQYTHAAIWAVWAYTKLHEGEKAAELFNMLNPINHARTDKEAIRYKVEPYVMAADVYACSPNNGRGGWSWYTGAAGWMYQVALEGILGLNITADKILINPCIPKSWPGFKVKYKYRSSQYNIEVINGSNIEKQILLDGQAVDEAEITLIDDGQDHEVLITISSQ